MHSVFDVGVMTTGTCTMPEMLIRRSRRFIFQLHGSEGGASAEPNSTRQILGRIRSRQKPDLSSFSSRSPPRVIALIVTLRKTCRTKLLTEGSDKAHVALFLSLWCSAGCCAQAPLSNVLIDHDNVHQLRTQEQSRHSKSRQLTSVFGILLAKCMVTFLGVPNPYPT
jgi:hypothetical protein